MNSEPEDDLAPDEDEEDLEWDDTPTALALRAVFTLLASGFLLWSQLRAPFRAGAEWNRWVLSSVVADLLLPLGIVWMFFAQGVRRVPYLRNPALNAWNYGWDFRAWKTHARWSLGMFAAMLPLLWWASRDAGARTFYVNYFPSVGGAGDWLRLIASLVIYMFCWEWFFRGFLLFGIAQGFPTQGLWGRIGPMVAILTQAVLFGLAHGGKPLPEYYASFAGGLVLGVIAWRQKSFAVAFYTHALLHIAWALLVLL